MSAISSDPRTDTGAHLTVAEGSADMTVANRLQFEAVEVLLWCSNCSAVESGERYLENVGMS